MPTDPNAACKAGDCPGHDCEECGGCGGYDSYDGDSGEWVDCGEFGGIGFVYHEGSDE